jgi:hypothetical protein
MVRSSGDDVQRAAQADWEAISAIHVRSWQWAHRGVIPDRAFATLTATERSQGWRLVLVTKLGN